MKSCFPTAPQRYEGTQFKMTELGPIPSDWEVKRLGEMLSFKNGFNANAKCYGTGTPVASVLDALSNGPITTETIATKVTADDKDRESFSLTKGDLIFTRSSETLEDVGRANVYFDDVPAMFGGFVIRGRFKIQANPIFVNYLLKTSDNRLRVMSQGAGAQHFNIGQSGLENVLIALPPLPEQHRIAAALSDVDELIGALGKLVEKKRAIKTGAMQRLLTGQTRLPGFGGEWEEKRLGEIGKFSKGAGISKEQSNSGLLPAVRYGELYTTHHDYIKHFESFISEDVAKCATQLHEGDIVFACSGETKEEIGKCAAYLGKEVAYAGGDLIIFTPKAEYDSLFLGFELNTPFCAQQKAAAGQGDAVVHIRQESIAAITISVPPTLPEQRAISAVLSDMDEEIAALEAEKRKVEAIKQGMMQELLTGKTRLCEGNGGGR